MRLNHAWDVRLTPKKLHCQADFPSYPVLPSLRANIFKPAAASKVIAASLLEFHALTDALISGA